MRFAIVALITLSAFACKPRDPDAGGLFSDDGSAADVKVQIAKGGDWDVLCSERETEDVPLGTPTYLLEVEGAVNEGDEAQEILVTVKKSWSGRQDVLVEKELGHGAVSTAGPLFLGFTSGVLTGDATSAGGKASYVGVLTLTDDESAEGLKVSCSVSKVSRG